MWHQPTVLLISYICCTFFNSFFSYSSSEGCECTCLGKWFYDLTMEYKSFILFFSPLKLLQALWLYDYRGRVCFSGLSSEGKPLQPEGTGPELQSSREKRIWAALCCTGGSTVQTGETQVKSSNIYYIFKYMFICNMGWHKPLHIWMLFFFCCCHCQLSFRHVLISLLILTLWIIVVGT